MLSDEERKAIEELKKVRWNSLAIVVKNEDGKMDISYFTEKHKKTLLNLIEKQSKEIKELKKYEEGYKLLNYSLDNYTSNDKIKAKIEEWQKEKEFYNKDEDREWGQYNNWDWIDTIINELQSLLEKE